MYHCNKEHFQKALIFRKCLINDDMSIGVLLALVATKWKLFCVHKSEASLKLLNLSVILNLRNNKKGTKKSNELSLQFFCPLQTKCTRILCISLYTIYCSLKKPIGSRILLLYRQYCKIIRKDYIF